MLNASLIDVPRPFIDPIDSLVEALGVLALALVRPLREGTLLLVLDSHRRGLGMVRSTGVTPAVMHDLIGHACRIPDAASVVLVSVRTRDLLRAHDADELKSHRRTMDNAGLVLHDWIIVGRGGLYCPRSIAGVADPWPSAVTCL